MTISPRTRGWYIITYHRCNIITINRDRRAAMHQATYYFNHQPEQYP